MFKNLRKKKKGFTLIELIIVVAILAILAAVAIPRLGGFTDKANRSADEANEKVLRNAAALLYAEQGDKSADKYKIEAETGGTDNALEALLDEKVTPPNSEKVYQVEIKTGGDITIEKVAATTTP